MTLLALLCSLYIDCLSTFIIYCNTCHIFLILHCSCQNNEWIQVSGNLAMSSAVMKSIWLKKKKQQQHINQSKSTNQLSSFSNRPEVVGTDGVFKNKSITAPHANLEIRASFTILFPEKSRGVTVGHTGNIWDGEPKSQSTTTKKIHSVHFLPLYPYRWNLKTNRLPIKQNKLESSKT